MLGETLAQAGHLATPSAGHRTKSRPERRIASADVDRRVDAVSGRIEFDRPRVTGRSVFDVHAVDHLGHFDFVSDARPLDRRFQNPDVPEPSKLSSVIHGSPVRFLKASMIGSCPFMPEFARQVIGAVATVAAPSPPC